MHSVDQPYLFRDITIQIAIHGTYAGFGLSVGSIVWLISRQGSCS